MDEELYSRQIAAYGLNIMTKLSELKILIIGLGGLGIEIAKNISLAGVKQVTIFDKNIVTLKDLGTNYYLRENDIGKRRDKSCINKLKELNNYVKYDILENEKLEESIIEYNVVVISEIMKFNKLFLLNDICHKKKIGFIYSLALGLTFFCFVDYGEHNVHTQDNSDLQKYYIKSIEKGEKTKIYIDNTLENFSLYRGDTVKISEIKGMTQLLKNPFKIIIQKNYNSFEIDENSLNYDDYIEGGIVDEIRTSKKYIFKSLKESLTESFKFELNNSKSKDLDLHIAFIIIHQIYEKENKLFNENYEEFISLCIENIKNLYKVNKINLELINKIYKYCNFSISSICGYGGGVVSQEIIKYTGIYQPIYQWFRYEFYNIMDESFIIKNKENTRYDDQILIFGNETQRNLENLNLFLIGAGATGCELLKNFAMMGIASNTNSIITVTDHDNIEKSNLNRQFLFRLNDLLKPKSEVAINSIKLINNKLNLRAFQECVNKDTEDIFNEDFWKKQDAVIMAVDNYEARRYISKKCEDFNIIYFNCGTNGTYANFEAFIPGKTAPARYPYNYKNEVPSCTIKMFPSKIAHCVQWAHTHFEKYFNDNVKNVFTFSNNLEEFYDNLNKINDLQVRYNKIKKTFKLYKLANDNNYNKCIKYAIKHFYKLYIYNINNILEIYPKDMINKKTNMKFWSGVKRLPHPLNFDINQKIIFDYIQSMSVNLARALGIDFKSLLDNNYIIKFCNDYKMKEFKKKIFESKNYYENKIKELKCSITNYLIKNKNNRILNIKPISYQKDTNNEFEINFIYTSSNLRARNYSIDEEEIRKIKLIAGKIIPSISTSTSAVTGLLSLQLYVICQNKDYNKFRTGCIDLSSNIINLAIPEELEETE